MQFDTRNSSVANHRHQRCLPEQRTQGVRNRSCGDENSVINSLPIRRLLDTILNDPPLSTSTSTGPHKSSTTLNSPQQTIFHNSLQLGNPHQPATALSPPQPYLLQPSQSVT